MHTFPEKNKNHYKTVQKISVCTTRMGIRSPDSAQLATFIFRRSKLLYVSLLSTSLFSTMVNSGTAIHVIRFFKEEEYIILELFRGKINIGP